MGVGLVGEEYVGECCGIYLEGIGVGGCCVGCVGGGGMFDGVSYDGFLKICYVYVMFVFV